MTLYLKFFLPFSFWHLWFSFSHSSKKVRYSEYYMINWLGEPFPPNLQNIIHHKSQELGIWNFERMFTPSHMSHVICHMSCVMNSHARENLNPYALCGRDTVKGLLSIIYINLLCVAKDLYPGTTERDTWRLNQSFQNGTFKQLKFFKN